MSESSRTYISLPPRLLAMVESEAKEKGNTISSVIRHRILDSYRREARDLGIPVVAIYEEESELTAE